MNTTLKRILFEREKTNRWLAQQCGADETGISMIINGRRVPSLLLALKIAKALEVSVEELWGYLLGKEEDQT